MDAVFNGVLDLLQAVTLPQTGKTQSKDGQSGGDPFAKLMEQQRQLQQDADAPAENAPENPDAPAAPEAPKAETDAQAMEAAGQMQMAWAALAMVNPMVQADPVVETVETQPVAVEAVAELLVDAEALPEVPLWLVLPPEAAPEISEAPAEIAAPAAAETAEAPEAEAPDVEAPRAEAAETAETVEAPQRAPVERMEAPEQETETEFTVEETVEAPQPLFRDTETIPVKVGEAELPQQEAEPVEHQLTKPILEAVQRGQSRVAVQLTPDNLGGVTVEITRSSDGTLHVSLSAERVETQGLLERHADQLQTMLAARNQDEVRVEVQRQEESGAYQPYDGRNGHSQQQRHEQQHQRRESHGQDFLQQLRLGLIPLDEA